MAIHPAIQSYGFTKQPNGSIIVTFIIYEGVNKVIHPPTPDGPQSIDLSYSELGINRQAVQDQITQVYAFNSANKFTLEFNTTETDSGSITVKRPRVHVDD